MTSLYTEKSVAVRLYDHESLKLENNNYYIFLLCKFEKNVAGKFTNDILITYYLSSMTQYAYQWHLFRQIGRLLLGYMAVNKQPAYTY